ncbi:endonuclease NucS domain-containing protein [Sapientia aquatica]|uniref:DUF91 domain-containing protein n=1 Tax=Sapientia aquatica TaxID=1549640 RepID=A0A4R5W372_9BURK|nr:endonuclease NucS domain-containing protein [Sapientia aquatica]TDK65838.1 DUF91 domain-containing protein [Sapientia aquatica]
MSIRTAVWKVGSQPQVLAESELASEKLLEDMIVSAPNLLSEDWLLIGRQVSTSFGGIIDLLAIAPDGGLVVIEIKRNRTPREVVAQALDYASWVHTLNAEEIANIYSKFAPGKNLSNEFQNKFGHDLDADSINESHQIVIVAGSLDDSTERIINYLSDREIAINVLCFQVFSIGSEQLISRAWLHDQLQVQVTSSASVSGPTEPWNGEFYHSFGDSESRSWEDAREFGFICGGGAPWYSRTLKLLSPGDRVWVNIPGSGYVGVGKVIGKMQPAIDFKVQTPNGEQSILEVAKRGSYHSEQINDAERCEYFVPISWLQTVTLQEAIQEIGLFGNQNTICRPSTSKWRSTVERLKLFLPKWNG